MKLAVFVLAASAVWATGPLQYDDIFRLEIAADPQISPDGTRIVYVRQFADVMTDQRYSNLWIVDFNGSNHRPLTTGKHRDTAPRWSPDGTQLLYLSDREGGTQLWRRWLDTGQSARLTNETESPATPSWSPDGQRIAFSMLVSAAAPRIIAPLTPPPGATWAAPLKVYSTLVYRHDRGGYLKPGFVQLFTIPTEGGTPRQITSGNFQHGGAAWYASEPVWTPDGKYLIASANRQKDFEQDPTDTAIHEFAVTDGATKQLTARKGHDTSPAVSPDGAHIAFTGFATRYQGYQVSKLHIMDRSGANSRAVTVSWDRDVREPRWSADGKTLYFLSDDQGETGLYSSSLDGSVKKLLSNVGASASASGSSGSFSLSRTGRYATTYKTSSLPGDIMAGSLGAGAPKTLTAVNDDLFEGRQLGEVEEIWYQASKDKRKIHGWIIKPPGFDPAKKYPLILEIHGGPFSNYGPRFDIEKQLMAAHGYVVLYTNPRGSTSYGEEFGNLIHHAYPGDDFDDLNSGVDAMVAKGYIDAARLYVTGGSGGGVLTCWVVGNTKRFRAAATIYPVVNWYSFVLTSDIGNWASKYWFPGLPWDNVEHYEKRSLLSVVKNVVTPTLVMVGEADFRTPASEAEQYYQALKLRGVETMLVKAPDEPHGINQRPSHHWAKIATIIAWFDQHK